jgi:hypothetical protein
MANSVGPLVDCHLEYDSTSTTCWPVRGGRGAQNTQKTLKNGEEKKLETFNFPTFFDYLKEYIFNFFYPPKQEDMFLQFLYKI